MGWPRGRQDLGTRTGLVKRWGGESTRNPVRTFHPSCKILNTLTPDLSTPLDGSRTSLPSTRVHVRRPTHSPGDGAGNGWDLETSDETLLPDETRHDRGPVSRSGSLPLTLRPNPRQTPVDKFTRFDKLSLCLREFRHSHPRGVVRPTRPQGRVPGSTLTYGYSEGPGVRRSSASQ